MSDEPGFDTLAVHGARRGDTEEDLVLASTFAFEDAADAAGRFAGTVDGPIYSRWGNPTVAALERHVAALEGAQSANAFASGMGAMHAAVASTVRSGDHVVAAGALYAETARLLDGLLARFGVQTTFVDMTDLGAVEAALSERTRLVVAETPANPTLAVTDLAALAKLVRGRDPSITLLVDSTFATPYHQRPLDHGADLVVHSATKALCGHGDALGGFVCGARERVAAAREVGARTAGAALAPMSAFLIARGVRTLGLRMARASSTAAHLAAWLETRDEVDAVHYPGLASHPQHAVAARQMVRGFGAQVAFELRGGRDAGARVYDRVEVITRAVSLGDVKTLITHPASTTHVSRTPDQRAAAGIGDGLMRLAVGVEDPADLVRDLDQALR